MNESAAEEERHFGRRAIVFIYIMEDIWRLGGRMRLQPYRRLKEEGQRCGEILRPMSFRVADPSS